MKLKLKLFLPMLAEAVGRSELELDFDGQTVGDLISHLSTRYGRRAKSALCDAQGLLDTEVQVLINERTWINRTSVDTVLRDGDQVTIMILLGGG